VVGEVEDARLKEGEGSSLLNKIDAPVDRYGCQGTAPASYLILARLLLPSRLLAPRFTGAVINYNLCPRYYLTR
jgi:hypothetical protein